MTGFCNSEKETGLEWTATQPTTKLEDHVMSLGKVFHFLGKLSFQCGDLVWIVATDCLNMIGARELSVNSLPLPRFILVLLVIHRRSWSLKFRSLSIVFKSRHSQTWDDKRAGLLYIYPDIMLAFGTGIVACFKYVSADDFF